MPGQIGAVTLQVKPNTTRLIEALAVIRAGLELAEFEAQLRKVSEVVGSSSGHAAAAIEEMANAGMTE